MEPRQETRHPDSLEQVPAQRLAQLRASGMHAIRFEFVVRLLRVEVKMDTMSIYWDHGAQELLDAKTGDCAWRLVLGRGRRSSTQFPDQWVMRYPGDPAVKRDVEAELDRLVEKARLQAADAARAGVPGARAGAALLRNPGNRI
jgi:hypothetical protein